MQYLLLYAEWKMLVLQSVIVYIVTHSRSPVITQVKQSQASMCTARRARRFKFIVWRFIWRKRKKAKTFSTQLSWLWERRVRWLVCAVNPRRLLFRSLMGPLRSRSSLASQAKSPTSCLHTYILYNVHPWRHHKKECITGSTQIIHSVSRRKTKDIISPFSFVYVKAITRLHGHTLIWWSTSCSYK